MQRAFDQFKENIKYVKELDALYLHLKNTLSLPNDLTDILRAEWVYTVSAMDKMIHELVRIGMIKTFLGLRAKTRKFSAFPISLDTYTSIVTATPTIPPPPEYYFEQEIVLKHKHLSFQDPDKINDALSLIWDDDNKWYKLSLVIGISDATLKTTLKTIISRRNQIVHEADLDLSSGLRNNMEKADIDSVITFIETLSEAIFNFVR